MANEIVRTNECWWAAFSVRTGDVIRLTEVQTGTERVFRTPDVSDAVAEGGHSKPQGLSIWTKTGDIPDHNTGVLSTFADIHSASRSVAEQQAGVTFSSQQGDVRQVVTCTLPPGNNPLRVSARIENHGATAAPYQFECFYQWLVTPAAWAQTAYSIPGLAPRSLFPFGELYFRGGTGMDSAAAWWQMDTTSGVVVRPVRGVHKCFVGVQIPSFILGPHSECVTLMPGKVLEMEFEIAPLRMALQKGWFPDKDRLDRQLHSDNDKRIARARAIGGVREWCTREPPVVRRRAIHLTTQYSPGGIDEMLHLVEKVVVPAGFNEVVFEVGRNFRYLSHPKVGPAWVWDSKTWKSLVKRLKGMGLAVIPQYNALGHQGESGLTVAYPELSEDPNGWCLDPENPKTAQYLGDLFDELIEAFGPKEFHVGLDEIDVPSRPQSFALEKGGRKRDGGKLFALHVNNLHAHLKKHGLPMMMWADMLLYKEEHRINHGERTGTWRAVDMIPKDITMIDWIYHVVPDFGGSRYLQEKGFKVMGACWHTPENIRDWAIFAVKHRLEGLMHTTWAVPRIRDINMVCTLLAGRYFQNPDAGSVEDNVAEAESLSLALVGEKG